VKARSRRLLHLEVGVGEALQELAEDGARLDLEVVLAVREVHEAVGLEVDDLRQRRRRAGEPVEGHVVVGGGVRVEAQRLRRVLPRLARAVPRPAEGEVLEEVREPAPARLDLVAAAHAEHREERGEPGRVVGDEHDREPVVEGAPVDGVGERARRGRRCGAEREGEGECGDHETSGAREAHRKGAFTFSARA